MLKRFLFLSLAAPLWAEAEIDAADSIEPQTHQFAGYLSGEVRTLAAERLALEKAIKGVRKSGSLNFLSLIQRILLTSNGATAICRQPPHPNDP